MTISLLYLSLLFLGNFLYRLENIGGKIHMFGKKTQIPKLPYPDLILNSFYLWAVYFNSDQLKPLLLIVIFQSITSCFYLFNGTKNWLHSKSIDFNAISSTLFFGAALIKASSNLFAFISMAIIFLFFRNLIGSIFSKVSLIEFDPRLKFFSGYFLALQVFTDTPQQVMALSLIYFLIDLVQKWNLDIDQFSKRIAGTNKVLSSRFVDYQKYLLAFICVGLIISNENVSIFISNGILVLAAIGPIPILYENILAGLNISLFDRRQLVLKIDGSQNVKKTWNDDLLISKGLAKARYSTYYLDQSFYVNFPFGLWPQKIKSSNFFSSIQGRNFIHINLLGANLNYNSLDFKEFKAQFVVQKFIANKRNEIKTAIHISEDLEDKYDYSSNIEAYISKNHLVSAAQHSKTIKTIIQENKLFIDDIYNKGIFDLNIMHKRNASIGDLSLRLFANLNFIEIATRFIVVITHLEQEKDIELGGQISFGLMVSKLRETGIGSRVKHDTSGYHEILKSALSDLKFNGKVPVKQTLIDLLNSATYIRNKTQGHGSALHISDEIWMTSEIISYHILRFVYEHFGSIYFYKKTGNNLFEVRSGLELKQNIRIMSNEDYFIRFQKKSYKSELLIPYEDYWYIIDSCKSGSNEFISFINGERVKPDIIQQPTL